MTTDVSSNPRRYLAIWFPYLPADRLDRTPSSDEQGDLQAGRVWVNKVGGALRVQAVDRAAATLGLAPGLTLADARARVPGVRTVAFRPDLDATLLAEALEDFDRFSPMGAFDGPDGLILDMTGCTHLFSGEAGSLTAVDRRAKRLGLDARLAMADTPQAARALSRWRPQTGDLPSADQAGVLADLPIAALELDRREEQALSRAGLKTLGAIDRRDAAALAARFGRDFPARLARVLGREDIRIRPVRPPAPCVVDRVFLDPISADEDLHRVLADLLEDTRAWLETRSLGGRAFRAVFYRIDGQTRRITLRTGLPTRDPGIISRLFKERLAALANPLDPGFGFDQIRLEIVETQPVAAHQSDLEGQGDTGDGLGQLLDRLIARLGPEAVVRFEPLDSHVPERAERIVPVGHASVGEWPRLRAGAPPSRPLQMFDPPQPIETLAEIPDGHPLKFRWRRVQHEVACAEGPERIAPEWWRGPGRTRDYYRVEDREGRRFWLFRSGLYEEGAPPRWFIHGLFA